MSDALIQCYGCGARLRVGESDYCALCLREQEAAGAPIRYAAGPAPEREEYTGERRRLLGLAQVYAWDRSAAHPGLPVGAVPDVVSPTVPEHHTASDTGDDDDDEDAIGPASECRRCGEVEPCDPGPVVPDENDDERRDVPYVNIDDVRDPNFCGGLDPVTYLDKLHAGELTNCAFDGCTLFDGHEGGHKVPCVQCREPTEPYGPSGLCIDCDVDPDDLRGD